MSRHYDVGDETVWNPSNGAARLFHAQLTLFEAELGIPSGIGPLPGSYEALREAELHASARELSGRMPR